jgi:hypothetical protein
LKEAHKDAEELQDEEVHGVPDVEHEMKKVIRVALTLLRISMYHLGPDIAGLSSSHFQSILGGTGGVFNLRGNNGVE